jgi:hypothetical protein
MPKRAAWRTPVLAVVAMVAGLVLVAIAQQQASGAPTATTAELIVQKGGDRTGAQAVAGLANAVFDFFAGVSGTPPAANAVPTATCTTDANGQCAVNVPGRTAATEGYWIRERTAPTGFHTAEVLDTGSTGNNAGPQPYNQLFTGAVFNNITYTFPVAGTGSAQSSRGSFWADIRDNPPLPPGCGLNIALLIDTSGSIGADIGNVKAAANGFVDALTGTPSQVALFSFATNASQQLASTAVSTSAGAATVEAAVNALPNPSGSTNWDQGLFLVAAQTTRYDAVVMLTDGNPTVYGPPVASGPGDHTRFREVENGIFSANAVKAKGTRIVVVGVGSGVTGATENLQALSGTTAGSDYFQTDYAALGTLFRQLALTTCLGTVSVVKQVIPPGGTVANAQPAGGWTITSSTTGVTPVSAVTDAATGGASFTAPLGGQTSLPVTLAETQQAGFTLQPQAGFNAVCTDSTNTAVPVTNAGALGFTVSALLNDAVTCTMYNLAPNPPAQVRVNKVWNIDGTQFVDGSQPANFQSALSLTGQVNPEFATIYSGFQSGDSVTVGETLDAALLPPGCTNVPSGDLGPHTLVAGLNTYDLTNTVTCVTTLTLLKNVLDPFGPAADPTQWMLTGLADNSSQTFSGTTGVSANITPNLRYDLSESTVAGYSQQIVAGAVLVPNSTGSWHCVLRLSDGTTGPEFDGLNGGVSVTPGQNAECTAINTAQPARLTLRKDVFNSNGGTAVPADFTLTATPQSRTTGAETVTGLAGQATVTNRLIAPLVGYVLTESGPSGYVPQGSPSCLLAGTTTAVPVVGGVVFPLLGTDVVCTFSNQDVPPTAPPSSAPPTTAPPTTAPPTSAPPTTQLASLTTSASNPALPATGTPAGQLGRLGVLLISLGSLLLLFSFVRERFLRDIS